MQAVGFLHIPYLAPWHKMWFTPCIGLYAYRFPVLIYMHHTCPLNSTSADFKHNKDVVLDVLVDKVTNVKTVVPEAWGVCTKY